MIGAVLGPAGLESVTESSFRRSHHAIGLIHKNLLGRPPPSAEFFVKIIVKFPIVQIFGIVSCKHSCWRLELDDHVVFYLEDHWCNAHRH